MKYLNHLLLALLLLSATTVSAQKTLIKGFAHVDMMYSDANKNKVQFVLGEQDLFITSQITERISFLGETVFKYSPSSSTDFSISVERLIIKFNIKGNNNIVIGKHHTPVSYWNDTYHHGRVFFPTVNRPELFGQHFVELHTTGIGVQGFNLGKVNFGYQVMVGNSINDDNLGNLNAWKSMMAEIHIKPVYGLKIGISGFFDKFPIETLTDSGDVKKVNIVQKMGGAYIKYSEKRIELLSECFVQNNDNDSTGMSTNIGAYVYLGYRTKKKVVPYARYDITRYGNNEIYLRPQNTQIVAAGLRYEFSFLATIKLEYNYVIPEGTPNVNKVLLQFAVGF